MLQIIFSMFLSIAILNWNSPVIAQDSSWKIALGNPDETAPELREEVIKFPLQDAAPPAHELIGTIYRPQGAGPFPVIILNHGAPANRVDAVAMGRYRLLMQIRALVENGFAVLVPMRRGYGQSIENYAESFGSCYQPRFDRTGTESARDIRSAIAWLHSQPDLQRANIILMGQSAGGFASIAAASEGIPGVVAVINMAGGRGGNGFTGIPCNVKAMTDVFVSYGGITKVPALWFYVENDKYFGPETSKNWFDAWQGAGGKGQYVLSPSHGKDGHLLFYHEDGLPIWLGAMRDFMKSVGLGQLWKTK